MTGESETKTTKATPSSRKREPSQTSDVSFVRGTRLGRYQLIERLGHGGMATVYLARLTTTDDFSKWVAVKVIHPHLAHDEKFVRMFLDEAHVAARIRHPSVCPILDFGRDEQPYIVLEYLHGETLAMLIRHGWRKTKEGLPPWLVARIVADVARGLHAAHELTDPSGTPLGVVHRDVSPHNVVVLYDGPSKITDFGVASARGRLTETKTGEIKGKYPYLAPEMLMRHPLDRRSDVWALGVTLWEATTGHRLFRSDNDVETLQNVLQKVIPKPSELVDDYPEALEAAVLGCLEREPEQRTQTAEALADALERYLYGLGEPAGPAQVSAWMNRTLAERRAARDAYLNADPGAFQSDAPPDDTSVGSILGTAGAPAKMKRRRTAGIVIGVSIALASVVLWTATRSSTEPIPKVASHAPKTAPQPPATAPTMFASAPAVDPPPVGVETVPPVDAEDTVEAAEQERRRQARRTRRGRRGRTAMHREDPATRPNGEPSGRAPAMAAVPGTLNLLAIPAAEVVWRGRTLGRTPLVGREFPPGEHRLALRPLAGGDSRTVVVRIESGQRTRRSVSLRALTENNDP